QAEDGIRDFHVTGVQKCALPISTLGIPNVAWIALLLSVGAWVALEKGIYGRWVSAVGQNMRAARLAGVPVDGVRSTTYVLCAVRSEERRVGKEGRSVSSLEPTRE